MRLRLQRETLVLGGVCLLVAIMFFIAAVSVHAYNNRVSLLSVRWARRGSYQLAAGNPAAAIEDFRNALAYDAQNADYQLHLAQALGRVGKPDEARAYLLHLWRNEPGNGVVNLELARLSARQGEVDDALRYFHNAIYGVWDTNPDESRRNVRLELVAFLLQNSRNTQADAELISLQPSLPRAPEAHVEAGNLFLRAGDSQRALEEFQQALRLGANNPDAVVGAGRAAFALANVRLAQQYLSKAALQRPASPQVQSMLAILEAVHKLDAFEFRLSRSQRAARANLAFQTVMQRLQNCTAVQPSNAPAIQAQISTGNAIAQQLMKPRYLYKPDAIDKVMSFVFDAEAEATKHCGLATTEDAALQLIARMHESR